MSRQRLPIAAGLAISALLAAASPGYARSAMALSELPSALIRVTDAESGVPVIAADVLVTFIEGDPDHPLVVGPVYGGRTNGGGFVLFKGLPEGDYIVSVSAGGYVRFGDGPHGDRPPLGAHIVVAYERGGGATGHPPARLRVELIPVTCRECS
jgi:hypothetical protein